MSDKYSIEVEAEGWPRNIGPFGSREAARFWLEGRIVNGSWMFVPLTDPRTVQHLGQTCHEDTGQTAHTEGTQ